MKTKDFDKLIITVGLELTKKQRYLLFKDLYKTYTFEDMLKFEKTMLKQIKSSSADLLDIATAIKVNKACDVILKSNKKLQYK